MKRTILIMISGLLMATGLQAQTKMNAVKTDLFSPILRTYVLKYERAINEDMSVQLGFFYTSYEPSEVDTKLSGFSLTPEFRYYLSETPAPNGTYLAPNVRYYKFTLEDPDVDAEGTLSNFSLALNIGKQVVLKDVIVIDAWVGPSYNFRTLEESTGTIDPGNVPDADGWGMRAGLAIGLVF